MKKKFLSAILAILFIFPALGQKSFEGKIVYAITFDMPDLPPEAALLLKDAKAITYIKGEKRRVDISMAVQSTSAIIDDKAKTAVTLMDIIGKRYLIRSSPEDLKKEEEGQPETSIVYTKEKKTIAGFKCRKARVVIKNPEGTDTVDVYYTTKIPTPGIRPVYKGLMGFPLEYSTTQGGIRMLFTASSVSKEKVPDSQFAIPEGYKEITFEDFQKEMMMMSGE